MSSLRVLLPARRSLLLVALIAVVPLLVGPAAAQCPESSVPIAGLPQAGNEFGTSIDFASGLAVIGAPGWAPPGGSDVGKVTLAEWNGSSWVASELPRPMSVVDDDRFGQAVAINESRDVIIVGAPGHDAGAVSGGLIVIYEYDGGTGNWVVVQQSAGIFANGFFGWSVSASGDRVAVGEPGGLFGFGTVNVYQRTAPGVWASDFFIGGYEFLSTFGWQVDIHADLLAIGVPLDDDDSDGDLDTGAVVVYERGVSGWTQRERLHDGGYGTELYGWSVSLFENALAVGWPGQATASPGGGAGVYEWNGTQYDQHFAMWNTGGPAYRIGGDVEVTESRGTFASPGWSYQAPGPDTGEVFVLGNDPLSGWYQPVDLEGDSPEAGAQFGFDTAIDGGLLLVGSPFADPGGLLSAGLVTAYDIAPNIPHTDLGNGLAGWQGQTPVLEGNPGFCDYAWEEVVMFGARPSSQTYVVIGITELSQPFKGGVLVPYPDLYYTWSSFPDGTSWAGGNVPTGLPAFSIWWQFWVKDSDGPVGWAATNALRADIPAF